MTFYFCPSLERASVGVGERKLRHGHRQVQGVAGSTPNQLWFHLMKCFPEALGAWDGAGVQRVRTPLWDHVTGCLS